MKFSSFRTFLFYALMIAGVVFLYRYVIIGGTHEKSLNFTEFSTQVSEKNIKSVEIKGLKAKGQFVKKVEGKTSFTTILPADLENFSQSLVATGVQVSVKATSSGTGFLIILNMLLPILLIGGLIWFFMKNMQQSGNKVMAFGKSRAKLDAGKDRVTFKDVAGMEEVKEEVKEVIEFLQEPQKFQKLGGTIPKGVLLMGAPGTGKTLLAKAIAGEADVPFFSISGSEFVEMFVGVGASRVRDTFEQAKKAAPCLIFIDEIDAVGKNRGGAFAGGGGEEREQTLNQLLVEMDGFDSNEGIIVIAATNRGDVLDPALLRPGRFDRRVHVPYPDLKGREAILKVHTRKVPLSKAVDLSIMGRGTPGFTGADLRNLVNEAALRAARFNKTEVDHEDFEYAKDKVIMGVERPSLSVSDEERKKIAYHEAGHAVTGWFQKNADPVHKVTIIPRGGALGVTQSLPKEDALSYSKSFLEAKLVVLMGGRAAEEIFMKTVTTGAANDLEQATDLARNMIVRWGMNDLLGPVSFIEQRVNPFSFRASSGVPYSEKVGDLIDQEVRITLEASYKKACTLLKKYKTKLKKVAEELLEKETLDKDQLREILGSSASDKPLN